MKAAILVALLLTTAAQAQPEAQTGVIRHDVQPIATAPKDHWRDEHQWQHFGGEAIVGGAAYALTDSRWISYGAAAVVGLGREEWKRRNGYANYNACRLIADVLGAVVGVESVRWFRDWRISPHINQGHVDGVFAVYSVHL